MVLKIYGYATSTCTRRVATVCKELGIPYEVISVDLLKGAQKSQEHLDKQPFGQVPVIDDDGFTLYESRAICRYLAAKAKSPLLPTPADVQRFGRFETAASIEYSNFDPLASKLAYEKIFKKLHGLSTDEKLASELFGALSAKLAGYEKILSKQKYLAGDEVTLADLFHLPYGTAVKQAGYDIFDESTPNIARWWKDITSRPSWQAVKDSA